VLESHTKSADDTAVVPNGLSLSQNRFGTASVIAGFVALALAVLPEAVLSPPLTASGILPLLKSALIGQKDPALIAFEVRLHQFHVASLVFAIAGTALGVIGLVRRNNRILVLTALAVSAVALLWQYLVVGIVVGVVLLVFLGTAI